MIGILLVAHGNLGASLIDCATHVLGAAPAKIAALNVTYPEDPAAMLENAAQLMRELDAPEGILVLSDMYGATPCNTVCRLLDPGRVEAVAGVNLPMLLKVLTNRHLPLPELAAKAELRGREGITHITEMLCDATKGA